MNFGRSKTGTVRYYLASADGVSEVASVGGYVKQYQIDIDPNTLLAYNVPLSAVYNAIRGSNLDVGAKVIEEGGMEFLIRGLGFIKNIADIENIVVKEHNGVPIYVKNLGTVSEGPDFRRGALDKAGIPATGGVVLMRYGDNPLRVIENVKAKIAELTPGLPSGVRIVPFYDRSHLIHRATDTLKETLTEEIIVAAVVILLFLGQVSSSLIIALVLPMGVLLAFVGMRIIGLPSNIMSMGGIAIAIGVMVDAGIVMTENITRHLQEPHPGESKLQVAIRAAKEVGPPIFFAMLIVIVAFIPVFSLTGQAGKLFKPLAYTKTFAMLGAALLAISLVPVFRVYSTHGSNADPNRCGFQASVAIFGVARLASEKVSRWNYVVTQNALSSDYSVGCEEYLDETRCCCFGSAGFCGEYAVDPLL